MDKREKIGNRSIKKILENVVAKLLLNSETRFSSSYSYYFFLFLYSQSLQQRHIQTADKVICAGILLSLSLVSRLFLILIYTHFHYFSIFSFNSIFIFLLNFITFHLMYLQHLLRFSRLLSYSRLLLFVSDIEKKTLTVSNTSENNSFSQQQYVFVKLLCLNVIRCF